MTHQQLPEAVDSRATNDDAEIASAPSDEDNFGAWLIASAGTLPVDFELQF